MQPAVRHAGIRSGELFVTEKQWKKKKEKWNKKEFFHLSGGMASVPDRSRGACAFMGFQQGTVETEAVWQ